MLLNRVIDKSTPIPLYFQLKQILLEQIKSGEVSTDEALPTEKELADAFDISRTTIRQALQELVQEGYLYRVKGRGTFVARPKDNLSIIQRLTSFDDHIKELGKTPRTEILSCEVKPMPAFVASELGCNKDSSAIELRRLRFSDEEPIVYTKSYLPYETCSCLLRDNADLTHLYNSMSAYNDLKVYKVVQSVEAVSADLEDAKYLQIPRRCPIQLISITAYNKQDIPVEFAICHFRGDRNKFQCVALVNKD